MDTASYAIDNVAKTVDLEGEIYEIVTLNENRFVVEEKERVDTPYHDLTLRFIKQ